MGWCIGCVSSINSIWKLQIPCHIGIFAFGKSSRKTLVCLWRNSFVRDVILDRIRVSTSFLGISLLGFFFIPFQMVKAFIGLLSIAFINLGILYITSTLLLFLSLARNQTSYSMQTKRFSCLKVRSPVIQSMFGLFLESNVILNITSCQLFVSTYKVWLRLASPLLCATSSTLLFDAYDLFVGNFKFLLSWSCL